MLGQLDMNGLDKVQLAIKRIKAYEPPEGYFLAFSGGKDSVVCKALCDMAGVKYDAHYNVTSVDPPELVRFVKSFPDVHFDIPHDSDGKPVTMWSLIKRKCMPPTRIVRYCCQALKEGNGEGRFVISGVRWAESARRKSSRAGLEYGATKSKRTELYDVDDQDNVDSPMFKFCQTHSRRILNPIIDWENDDIWQFIRDYDVRYCTLYDEGFERLGCIACPMATESRRRKELDRWPKYKEIYTKAFDRMLEERRRKGDEMIKYKFKDGTEVMQWWITGKLEVQEDDET